eukprot:GHVT01072470.1.p1 GENE.GHVT01072470.1~~GHVT01072470.1.p1  ORF type:complete len:114 (-),score=16.23 GHVT01072470.1:195-536(-)
MAPLVKGWSRKEEIISSTNSELLPQTETSAFTTFEHFFSRSRNYFSSTSTKVSMGENFYLILQASLSCILFFSLFSSSPLLSSSSYAPFYHFTPAFSSFFLLLLRLHTAVGSA